MKAWVYAHTPEDYAKWAAENLKAAGPAPTSQTVAAATTADSTTEGKVKP
jgi:heme/copper-type cytochrome/quinol oxidase subunit 2